MTRSSFPHMQSLGHIIEPSHHVWTRRQHHLYIEHVREKDVQNVQELFLRLGEIAAHQYAQEVREVVHPMEGDPGD